MREQVAAVGEFTRALENVSEMSQSISAAAEEQTTNAKQVSEAVENVSEVTQGAATSAEEMSASTEQLSLMAQELRKVAAQFTIGSDGSEKARATGSAVAGPAPSGSESFDPDHVDKAIGTGAMARELVVNKDGKVEAVSYIEKATREEKRIHARAFIVAASSCESARLLLNSRSTLFPDGLGEFFRYRRAQSDGQRRQQRRRILPRARKNAGA